MGGPVRRVPGLGVGHRDGRADHPGRGGPGEPARRADRAGVGGGVGVPLQRGARARPGARRRTGAGRGDPPRRRARRRQEHSPAGGGRPDGSLPAAHPLRHRRGVGLPGPAPGRPHRRGPRRALHRGRDRSRRRPDPHRRGAAEPAGRRLHPDDRCRRPRGGARRRHPGQGGGGGPDPGGQDPQHHHRPRRPRHQGRLDRGAPGPRARRRRRAGLRGRPQLALPDGPGHEEPLRPRRRGGLLRPLPRGHLRRHRPDRPVRGEPPAAGPRHLRRRHHGGPASAAGRGAGTRDPHGRRASAPYDVRARLLARGHGPRRPPAALRHPPARPRRLRLHRRWSAAVRAGERPRGRRRAGLCHVRRARTGRGGRHRRDRAGRRAAPGPRPAPAGRRGSPAGIPHGPGPRPERRSRTPRRRRHGAGRGRRRRLRPAGTGVRELRDASACVP